MCVVALPIAAAVMAAGTAVSMASAEQEAGAKSASAQYSAAVASQDATFAQQNADASLQAGQAAETQQRLKTAGEIGSERASMAAHGILLDSGSALDVQSGTAVEGELDAQTVRWKAQQQAQGYLDQGFDESAKSNLYSAESDWDQTAGDLSATSSLLAGAQKATSLLQ
jgi:hypothetical protein